VKTAAPCPDDLLVHSRAGSTTPMLSIAERRARDEHLTKCDLCRMSTRIARAIGPLPDVSADDRALAELLVSRALAPWVDTAPVRPQPAPRGTAWRAPRHRQRLRTLTVAAALVLLAGAASAAVWYVAPLLAGSGPRGGGQSLDLGGLRPGTAHRHIEPRVAAAPDAVPALVPEPAPPPRPPKPAPRAPVAPAQCSADSLFSMASLARHQRNLDEAEGYYLALQASFPRSPQAALSFLSLGELYLDQGAPAKALTQFTAYLDRDDGGLAQEAMVGQARALAKLRRRADERDVWSRLLRRFPASDYRPVGRARLEMLGGVAP